MSGKQLCRVIFLCFSMFASSETVVSQADRVVISDIAWNADGTQLAIARTDGTVEIVDGQGESLVLFNAFPEPYLDYENTITSVSWSPESANELAVGRIDGNAAVFDISRTPPSIRLGLTPRISSTPLNWTVEQIEWNSDGSRIALYGRTGGVGEYSDRLLTVWYTWQQGGLLAADRRNFDDYLIDYIAWSPTDPNLLAISSSPHYFGEEIRLWDVQNNQVLWKIQEPDGHSAHHKLAWSPDGTRLAYARLGASIYYSAVIQVISNVAAGEENILLFTNIVDGVQDLAWSSNNYLIAAGESLEIWDVDRQSLAGTYDLSCRDIAWSIQGDLACNSPDGELHIEAGQNIVSIATNLKQ